MSLFTTVVSKLPKRNAFNLSHENLLTMEFGELVPVMCKEVLPGDKFRLSTEAVIKTAPMLAPIFSRIDLYLHYFFVPNRLVHEDWEDFITTGTTGLETDLTPPYAKLLDAVNYGGSGGVRDGSLQDYFNLPKVDTDEITGLGIMDLPVNLSPFLAYQKIYSDWYRDELLDDFEFEPLLGGLYTGTALVDSGAFVKRYRAWGKDYFTSARPTAQLGQAIPIPVSGELSASGPLRLKYPQSYTFGTNNGVTIGGVPEIDETGMANKKLGINNVLDPVTGAVFYGDGISLDEAGVTVNDLRRALRLQEWQERNARGGNRYIENIYHHFGVRSSDARLQRSEYLGGRKCPIVISEIAQTSATALSGETTPLGQLAGRGHSVAKTGRVKWYAEEHGYIICIASIMPKAGYMQGLPRMYWRHSYLDYAWPLFGNLGEQEVYAGELYLAQQKPDKTFGYQSRYAEYKFSPNEVHGAFRSNMSYWHNYRIFDSAPRLNGQFVHLRGSNLDSSNKGQNRIFPTLPDGYGHFYVHLYHDVTALRALPKYGIPSI